MGGGGVVAFNTDDALAALLAASSDPVQVLFSGNTYTLTRLGLQNLWSTNANAVANADLWAEDTDVTVVIRQGDRGLAADGFHSIGTEINPNRPQGGEYVDRGFWHVDPETMEYREGFGGGGGGLPAAWIPETGITQTDVRNHKWRGLLVALAREDAGPDWRMLTAAGQEAVAATQASVQITSGGTTLTVTMQPAGAEGAAGNAWRLDVQTGTGTSAGRAPGTITIVLNVGAGATFANAASVINQRAALDGNRYSAVVTGTGTDAFPAAPRGVQNFSGGADAIPAAELGVEIDVGAKTITLVHLVGHTQLEIVAFLNELEINDETTLYAIMYGGSNPAARLQAAPQERPFGEVYSEGSLPHPTRDQLVALGQRIDNLTFANIGGMIADAQVPATFTRDAEITQAFLLNLLGLSAQQLNDLFVGAEVHGAGASQTITVTQADGSTIVLAVPGGVSGTTTADGRVTAAAFASDGTTLTLTLSTGATVVASVPAMLRQAGLSQPQVQALIDAAEADDLDAAAVAAQIQATIMGRRIPAAPAAAAERKRYELDVAPDGTTTWVEAATGGGGGDTPVHHSQLLGGTSTDAVPTPDELTIVPTTPGEITIGRYAGSRRHLLGRLVSQGDLTSAIRSDDATNTNLLAGFTKYGSAVTVNGADYAVWVSNQLLTNAADVTWRVA